VGKISDSRENSVGSPRRATRILSASAIATRSRIISASEVFGDGAIIEPVASSSGQNKPDLMLWDGRNATIGPYVEHRGCVYEAPELPPRLYRATRFPSGCRDYDSARGQFAAITGLFKRHADLPDRESSLLAGFSISTWLSDRLPSAPTLIISGPEPELGIAVLRLLNCVCRHPLLLAEVTAGSFRSLPMQLPFTLLLHQQELKPNLQRLVRASSYRGLQLPGNRESVVDLCRPKAIFCGDETAVDSFGGSVIDISAAPSQLQSSALGERAQNDIARDFQPRLLMYRLKNASKIGDSPVDVSNFTTATGQLARTLAACFPEDSELARDVVALLRPQDDEARGQRSREVQCVIVEILWSLTHLRKRREVMVGQLAQDVNALLRSRGEPVTYSAEEIGWKLRGLNIRRHTNSAGRQVLLGRETSQSIHRLARAYRLPCAQRVEVGCPDCNQEKPVHSK